MRTPEIIAAKRDGKELSASDIREIVLSYAYGMIPDYQMSAFLMAAYIRGLSFAETSAMTQAMIDSGAKLDLSSVPGIKVDKHSTGGVGDKTTPVIVPILAACGLKVPKMSGRGLGFTGGTLDKLESIPGFTTQLSVERFAKQLRGIGAAMAGQTPDLVPADKMMYALRDVTATVDSIPLIAASIMSKKIACASDIILLDVKFGSGAFVHDMEKARELARTMIAIGKNLRKKVGAVISDMSQPLGFAVGNALEVREAIDTLHARGPSDFIELCLELCAIMLRMAGQCAPVDAGRELAREALISGAALAKFREIIHAQDGDPRVADNPDLLPKASIITPVLSENAGVVSVIDTAQIGAAAGVLGAGRERKEDTIDPAVGIIIRKKLGDKVEKGEPIADIHANDPNKISEAEAIIKCAYILGGAVQPPPLISEVIL